MARNPPLSGTRGRLLQARKHYSSCARKVEQKVATQGYTGTFAEQLVGLGIAADWLRRAAELENVDYVGHKLKRSRHREGAVETLRFTFAWFGLNAVFSREELFDLVSPSPASAIRSEFALFDALVRGSVSVANAGHASRLHALLDSPVTTRLPGVPLGTSTTTLQALNQKFIPPAQRKRGTSAKIDRAATSGTSSTLTLGKLIYSFRNWIVHGNAMGGAFGGRPKLRTFVEVAVDAVSMVHLDTATTLLVAV